MECMICTENLLSQPVGELDCCEHRYATSLLCLHRSHALTWDIPSCLHQINDLHAFHVLNLCFWTLQLLRKMHPEVGREGLTVPSMPWALPFCHREGAKQRTARRGLCQRRGDEALQADARRNTQSA